MFAVGRAHIRSAFARARARRRAELFDPRRRPCGPAPGAYIEARLFIAGDSPCFASPSPSRFCVGLPAAQAQTVQKTVPTDPGEVRLSFAPVVKKVRPAVVNVYASRVETMPRNPLFDDPIFRRFFGDAGPEFAHRAIAGLGRDRRSERPRRHQPSRHRGHDRGEGRAFRPARIRGRDRAARPAHRSRGAQDQERREVPGARARRFRRDRGRRLRPRDRQSVRRRPDRDAGHRLGAGAHADRHQRLRLLHPDRRRDQSRQFRRRAGRPRRRASSASTRRSTRARAAAWASASPFRSTWSRA